MQKIILWGISERNPILREISENREDFGKSVFKLADKTFGNSSVDFRAVNAILVSAICYMLLHAKVNGSTICEIDLSTSADQKRIFDTIEGFINWSYKKGKINMI